MANQARDLEAKALGLPSGDRARLAELLLASLEGTSDPDAEALWLQEAERRLDELESGSTASIPTAEVLHKSRNALR